jgi:diketogulonate reductase-like aldo/keto reductase
VRNLPPSCIDCDIAVIAFVPAIPGTKRRKYLEENVGATHMRLTREDLAEIDKIAPKGVAAGDRYPEAAMAAVNR